MQRQEVGTVDLANQLKSLVTAANEVWPDAATVSLTFEGGPPASFQIPGHDSRLGQVVSNLIDNARSFSPPNGKVRVTCRRLKGEIEIIVDDDGPGIRPDALEKIFERFYTDRPNQSFGQNSGLGLSISKQIVEAHGGRMWAENRTGVASRRRGAEGARRALCGAPAGDVISLSNNSPLVPAKAGTQNKSPHWIPAYAGMSGVVRSWISR